MTERKKQYISLIEMISLGCIGMFIMTGIFFLNYILTDNFFMSFFVSSASACIIIISILGDMLGLNLCILPRGSDKL